MEERTKKKRVKRGKGNGEEDQRTKEKCKKGRKLGKGTKVKRKRLK